MDKEQTIEKIGEIIHSVRPEIGKPIACWKDRVAEKLYEAGFRIPEQTN